MEVLLKLKEKAIGSLVFHDGQGQKIENNKLRKELMKVSKKAGFPDVTKIHSLRHTFASHLVMKGVDLPTIKQLMGHSDSGQQVGFLEHMTLELNQLKNASNSNL